MQRLRALNEGWCDAALYLLDDARAAGEVEVLPFLGYLYEEGICLRRDPAAATALYQEAIEQDYDLAKARLGSLHLHGLGVPRDRARARALFWEVAIHFGIMPQRLRYYFLSLVIGYQGIPFELQAELAWLREVETAEPRRQYAEARWLKGEHGDEPRARDLAAWWLEEAADQGLPEAQFELGTMWIRDPVMDSVGFGYLERAADQGYVPALLELGWRYAKGEGFDRWPSIAYYYLYAAKLRSDAPVDELLAELESQMSRAQVVVARDNARRLEFP